MTVYKWMEKYYPARKTVCHGPRPKKEGLFRGGYVSGSCLVYVDDNIYSWVTHELDGRDIIRVDIDASEWPHEKRTKTLIGHLPSDLVRYTFRDIDDDGCPYQVDVIVDEKVKGQLEYARSMVKKYQKFVDDTLYE